MSQSQAVVGVFKTFEDAEDAIREIQASGFDMQKLSLVGKGYHTEERVVGFYNTGDRMQLWGQHGAFWGALWGLFFGSAFFVLPGLGPIMMAGPLAALFVATLEGAVVGGGLSALGAALVSIGVPPNSTIQYEAEIKVGKYLVIAHGTEEELAKISHFLEPAQQVAESPQYSPV